MAKSVEWVCCWLLATVAATRAESSESCEQQIVTDLMSEYSKNALPSATGADVLVELHVQEISSVSEMESQFVLDILFSTMWRDERLSFAHSQPPCAHVNNITVDGSLTRRLWTPNMCILNSKSAQVHHSPEENLMMILYKNGTVWHNVRMRVAGPCQIDLRYFPFDKQTCSLLFESYRLAWHTTGTCWQAGLAGCSYNTQRVRLNWMAHSPLTFMHDVRLPDFALHGWRVQKVTQQYPNGEWDELKAYFPTIMTQSVAWISMLMDHRQVSARATLAISAFLALTLQYGNVIKNQPPVSYVKSLDIWMLGGILFMFSTLAELAAISYMQRDCRHLESSVEESPVEDVGRRLAGSNGVGPTASSPLVNNHQAACKGLSLPLRLSFSQAAGNSVAVRCQKVDACCRRSFLLAFLLFNLVYWSVYADNILA